MKSRAEQVCEQVQRLILDGYYPPGQVLPHIRKLADSFKVSIATAQLAIHALRKRGMVESKRGRGVFVKYPLSVKPKGRRVGLIFPYTSDFVKSTPYPARAVNILERILKKEGYDLISCPVGALGLTDAATHLKSKKLNGVILLAAESYRLLSVIQDQRLPVISMDVDLYRQGISSVTFDNLRAGFLATSHLIAKGHERIRLVRELPQRPLNLKRFMGQPMFLNSVQDHRIRGYALAMQNAGLVQQPVIEVDQEHAGKNWEEILRGPKAPTALFCLSHRLAPGLAPRFRRMGIRVPEDLCLMGVGTGVRTSKKNRFPSIGVDYEGLGRCASRLYLDAIHGQPLQRKVLPVSIVTNESVSKRLEKSPPI